VEEDDVGGIGRSWNGVVISGEKRPGQMTGET